MCQLIANVLVQAQKSLKEFHILVVLLMQKLINISSFIKKVVEANRIGPSKIDLL